MGNVQLKIIKHTGYNEYCVKPTINNIPNESQSYYTDDKQDAIDTCNQMKLEYEQKGYTVSIRSGIQFISGD